MKIERLIGILSILLQKDRVTAPELAEMFEVSKRTINRDIDALLRAGIPVVTLQGSGGGIRIMDGYRMDKTILSSKDMKMILSGLRSLDSVSGSNYYALLMEKIKAGSSEYISGSESILIDLSSWNKEVTAPKIELIQNAIEDGRVLKFEYYSPKENSIREIEPYYLVFKWSSWYVYGYCFYRNDFRLFKLNRMAEITEGPSFDKRSDVPMPDLSSEKVFPRKGRMKAIFDSSMKWRLIEDFGIESFKELPDGNLLFEHDYSDDEGILSWMLTMKDKVTVIEPESIREKLLDIASEIVEKYRKEERQNEEMV